MRGQERVLWVLLFHSFLLSPPLAVARSNSALQIAPTVLCDGQVRDSGGNPPAQRLILRSQHSNAIIRNCTFRNFKNHPIVIDGANDILIENNRFENNRPGVSGTDTHAIAIPTRGARITIRSNTFVDTGADGIQLGDTGVAIREIDILHNDFSVTNDSVGENGIDIKTVQGPVRVVDNRIHGFRPCETGQDCSGDPTGAGVVLSNSSKAVVGRKVVGSGAGKSKAASSVI
jgi:Right handed beta helix region